MHEIAQDKAVSLGPSKKPGPEGMVVSEPTFVSEDGDTTRASAIILIDNQPQELWFRFPNSDLSHDSTALLAASLAPAMGAGLPLTIRGPVSRKLLASVPTIQDILHAWYPGLEKISVQAGHSNRPSGGSGVGTFFTGGVDSFYTFLRHREEIGTLIFVHGFDVKLDKQALRSTISATLRQIAREFGKELIEIETNLREFTRRYCEWGPHSHGSALASVAHFLSPRFSKIFIPSTFGYSQFRPWGSNPLLDPLWGSESMELDHDGCEAMRLDKIRFLAESDAALQSLRVCYENPRQVYNCGRCEKCLRTMAMLRTVGALQRCPTFDKPLNLEYLSRSEIPKAHRHYYESILNTLAREDRDAELARAVRHGLRDKSRNRWSRYLGAFFQR
jgi:hypothetical protein